MARRAGVALGAGGWARRLPHLAAWPFREAALAVAVVNGTGMSGREAWTERAVKAGRLGGTGYYAVSDNSRQCAKCQTNSLENVTQNY